ncbi:unnamed protein product [Enterobius vermicularis]|uniref:Reticulon n=1 Tax=Enterobius vermicularis TaxID=51028 RepID=A0A0N4VJF1_ENTVE|nr:unnamed protein product [Enterobius vermicularis]
MLSSEADDALRIAEESMSRKMPPDVVTENFSEHLVKNVIKDVVKSMKGEDEDATQLSKEKSFGADEDISMFRKSSYEHETDYEADLKEKLEMLELEYKKVPPLESIETEKAMEYYRNYNEPIDSDYEERINSSATGIVSDVLQRTAECLSQTSSTYRTATSKDGYETCVTSQEDGFETADSCFSQDSEYTTATSGNESRVSEISDERRRGSVTPLAASSPVGSVKNLLDSENEEEELVVQSFSPSNEFISTEDYQDSEEKTLRTSASGVLLAPVLDPGRPVSPVPPRPLDEERTFSLVHKIDSLELEKTHFNFESSEHEKTPTNEIIIKLPSEEEENLDQRNFPEDFKPSFSEQHVDYDFEKKTTEESVVSTPEKTSYEIKEEILSSMKDLTEEKQIPKTSQDLQMVASVFVSESSPETLDAIPSVESLTSPLGTKPGAVADQLSGAQAVSVLPPETAKSVSPDSLEKVSDKGESDRGSSASQRSSSSRKSSYEEPETFTERLTPELKIEWSESTSKPEVPQSLKVEGSVLSPEDEYQPLYTGAGTEQVPGNELATVAEEGEEAESSNGRSLSSNGHSSDPLALAGKYKHASSDNVSETSLQEFERIERDVLNRGEAGLSSSELELYLSGKLKGSTNGSQSSLTEFERLEEEIGEGSPQEEVMILSDIREESEVEDMSIRDDDEEEHDSIAEIKSVPVSEDKQISTPLASPTDSIEKGFERVDPTMLETSTDSLEIYDPISTQQLKISEGERGFISVEKIGGELRDSLEDIVQEKTISAGRDFPDADIPQTSSEVLQALQDINVEKDSLSGDLDTEAEDYPTTLTTFETTQVLDDGYIETISRRVLTKVKDPVITHVQFTGTENEERVRQLARQEQYETSDPDGNVTKTIYIRREASSSEGN